MGLSNPGLIQQPLTLTPGSLVPRARGGEASSYLEELLGDCLESAQRGLD
jgi:hypothetical protein